MADVTVSQFAQVLKVPVDRLIVQLDQAGIKVEGPEDRISDDAKLELLSHLRKSTAAMTRAAARRARSRSSARPRASSNSRARRDAPAR